MQAAARTRQQKQRHSRASDQSNNTDKAAADHGKATTRHTSDHSSSSTAHSKPKQQSGSITAAKLKNGQGTLQNILKEVLCHSKLSTPPRKIQWTTSGKTIQISRYDRRLNNMRHQGTHDDCTIDGDAPTIDDDVTMRQEKSSGTLVPKSSGGQGPVQD
ncbi:hypothetical protein Ae201684P_007723 [Aphanomyces euteiches]|nr:hypothetical protein Ae201684P_007723 [Aphanomyces euteiches]